MTAFASVFARRGPLARKDLGMGHRQRFARFKNRLLRVLVKFGVLHEMTAKLTARLADYWPLTP
jgi:hypothetical protein